MGVQHSKVACYLVMLILSASLSPLLSTSLAVPAFGQSLDILGESKLGESQSNLVVDEVKIEGNRLIPADEIAKVIKTRKGDRFDRSQIMNDLKAIDGMGFFNKNSLQVNHEVGPSGLLLKFRVEENPPITQFVISGNSVISTEEISEFFADQVGLPSNPNALSNAISKVEQAYRDRGYVLAQVSDVKDNPGGRVELCMNEGTIDDIVITGNKKTQDYLIRHAFKLKAGSVYNEKELTNDLRKLYANGYFQDVRRSLVPSERNPGKFTLRVEVDEKPWCPVKTGGNIDSLAGPFGSVGFSDNNYGGHGQIISPRTQMGAGALESLTIGLNMGGNAFLPTGRTYNAEVSFIEPSLLGNNTSMSGTGFGRDMASMAISQSMQQTLGVMTNFSKPLGNGRTGNLGLTGECPILREVTNSNSSIGNMPQFSQYRLGGIFGNGVRGFRSFTDLGTASTMLMNTIELPRKLHLPGDNVVGKVINNNVKWTAWCDYGQVMGNNNMNSILGRSSYAPRLIDFAEFTPSLVRSEIRPACAVGDFPCRGIGWRNGLPVLEKPCTPALAPGASNGESPWVF